MYKLAVKKEDKNYQAIGLTLRALFMADITGIFGDVPFSEAFTMYDDDREPIIQPKFDEQKDIFTQLLADLEMANGLYSPSVALEHPAKDLLYKGDLVKWKKFTNSLYLRLLMRLSNRDNDMNVSTKIAEIFGNPGKYPVFENLEDGAILYYTGVTPFQNTYGAQTDASWRGKTASKYIIERMTEQRSDPRLEMIYSKSGDSWNGLLSGGPENELDNTSLARLTRTTLGEYTSPYAFFRYDEVLFIKAEAAYRGWIPGGYQVTKDTYDLAVTESIKYWDKMAGYMLFDQDIVANEYLRRNPYDGTLERLIDEKYLALFWVGYEGWHDYRRTGYPDLLIGSATVNDGILPRRIEYPVNTRETNSKNYEEVITRYRAKYRGGADNMKTPVWWSLNAVETELY
jgi:hypothetical protein